MQVIVTFTINPAIDTSSSVNQVVAERKLRCSAPAYEPGGGGINVSRAIYKLGGTSTAVYFAGGPTGQLLRNLIDQENLKHHPIPIQGWTRENLTILEESTGRQYRFGMPGPALNVEEWNRGIKEIFLLSPKPDYIVASGSLPPGVPDDYYARLAVSARKHSSRIIVDTSGEALRKAIDAGVYLLKPNLHELAKLAGEEEIRDESHQEDIAMTIIKRDKCKAIVVSRGAGGAFLVTKEGTEHIRAPLVPIKSKVGAGDSMVAGIVLSLARGNSLQMAVRFGVAAGSAAVMTPGTELCRREDTERLYEQMKVDAA